MEQPMLKIGQTLKGQAACPCPRCGNIIPITNHLRIENLETISMILWTHEAKQECPSCHLLVMPVITQIDPSALAWAISPVHTPGQEPLIAPGQIDISKIGRKQ